MKAVILSFVTAGLLGLNIVSAEDIKPFDKQGRNNVVVKAQQTSDGSMANPNSIMDEDIGVDISTIKTIEVELPGVDLSDGALKIELVLELKDKQGSEWCAGREGVPDGVRGTLIFTTAPSLDNQYLARKRERTKGSIKVAGWCIRVIRDGQIVGVAGSPLRFEKLVASGTIYIHQ